jgi:hypothetical protein
MSRPIATSTTAELAELLGPIATGGFPADVAARLGD